MKKCFFLCLLWFVHCAYSLDEKPMVIVIASYNNANWYEENLRLVLQQKCSNYRVIYIDDASSDATSNLVEEYVSSQGRSFQRIDFEESGSIVATTEKFAQEVNEKKVFFTLVSNQQRCGALANQYRAILSCNDEEIVLLLDGDDWFASSHVLEKLQEVYASPRVWMTHGSLVEYPSGIQAWSEPIPTALVLKNAFRSFKCPSHLRTFYAWLFKRIRLEDLLYEGNFFSMTSDMAIMFPMVEMCGGKHAFIKEPLYIYNMVNPINDNKINAELQRYFDEYIRSKPPYKKLKQR